ncbi:SPOR domain-containing protein [Isoptericola sp. BMS4]|uniref:SPOR domain-containing protein n=1 Tax=Isoptericola sp. BMS4 TaxID=2527875 RepID=UPI001420FBAA|nr:SPOR domain-containing protein [Isoptericola sp. BMS4]
MSDTGAVQYWYNTKTGEVEESRDRSSWTHRMGPYPTRDAAQHALDTARRRNDTWEEEDDHWRGRD